MSFLTLKARTIIEVEIFYLFIDRYHIQLQKEKLIM